MPAPGHGTFDPQSVTLRRMIAADAGAALLLLEESPEASRWSRESLEQSISKWIAWVADLDGRVVGFLIGRPAADEFEILNLAVGKKFRRCGIATRLIHNATETALAAGVAQIFLEVRSSNLPGIALYTRLAFRVCGRRKNYYRDPIEDAVLLIFNNSGKDP
ncbi:MAG TPA: ribosomal protein S18-alanine N-acetyltransferase [Candidatus Saccharimonadales bacterium]|jgi:ribosomal-protein-alanine N-acetyltransferase|nr:ribosomal protein S18-alanine N-acetyltransferase [Candidatus Saccharimonadales bacterium]